jgi:hypothetical protein
MVISSGISFINRSRRSGAQRKELDREKSLGVWRANRIDPLRKMEKRSITPRLFIANRATIRGTSVKNFPRLPFASTRPVRQPPGNRDHPRHPCDDTRLHCSSAPLLKKNLHTGVFAMLLILAGDHPRRCVLSDTSGTVFPARQPRFPVAGFFRSFN